MIQEEQSIIKAQGDADIIVIQTGIKFACIVLVRVRGGEILDCESFFPTMPDTEMVIDTDDEILQQIFNSFVAFYYLDFPERIPKEIITDCKIIDKSSLESLLSDGASKKCLIKTAVRGKSLDYIAFARNNLNLAFSKYNQSKESIIEKLNLLAKFLSIEQVKKVECFDISHTQGNSTIASCVVFSENGPSNKEYRRFNIDNITKGDDYAALYNAIGRRYSNYIGKLPEVLLIDGGKGQVNVAKRVMLELNLQDITVLGVSKGRTRKAGHEKLILASTNEEQSLPEDSMVLHLIQQIRDEAHRFAITAHRRKRQKESLSSGLENIEGIGAKRRQALLKHFGGLREISKASAADIAKVSGISQSLATKIYKYLH